MASRILFSRRAVTPLATAVLTGMAVAPTTVFAEAPTDLKRKPIYDDNEAAPSKPSPPPTTSTLPSPSEPQQDGKKPSRPPGSTPTERLAVQIGNARLFLYKYVVAAEDKVNDTVDSAFHLEQSFTSTVASLAPPRESGEKLMPGSIYVLVAAMAGSILTRNRNIILRASMPLALGIGAGWAVIPITMRNVSDLAWKYEQRFPAVAEAHVNTRESLFRGVNFAKAHARVGARYVDEKVTDARETVEGWVKEGK